MSEAASPRGQEHSIDLGAVERPAPAADPEPPSPRRRPYLRNIVLAYAAIAIALAAAVTTAVKWSPHHRPVAEAAVQSFLESVRDGDVEAALARTDQKDLVFLQDTTVFPDPPSGSPGSSGPPGTSGLGGSPGDSEWDATRGDFLVPEALDPRWEIVTVAQVAYEERDSEGSAMARVYAEIEAYDGTRVGHRYQVGIEHGRAEIVNGIPEAEAWGAFDYLDMNGVRLRMHPDVGFANIYLLPGLYEFYPDLPSAFELDGGSSMLVLGDAFLTLGAEVPDQWMPVAMPMVSREGAAAVNAAIREHYEACAADPSGDGCPLAFPEDPEREVALAPGAAWEITAYPQVAAERLWYEYGLGYRLNTAVLGEAQVLAEITEDGRERTALVSCPIWADGLYARFDDAGGATVSDSAGAAADRCRSLIEVR